ncbi:hypothetical protein RU07_18840 [Agrobacterium tumefaciens]|uniref:Uncharacterized protein n=1 Tax=Agrobacterium tumefaciens TaxID=358 RepID=A0A0D0KRG5_AGRTU|nr:hypothetical protein RU07_18840 [Agrobacterium tumefaciens]
MTGQKIILGHHKALNYIDKSGRRYVIEGAPEHKAEQSLGKALRLLNEEVLSNGKKNNDSEFGRLLMRGAEIAPGFVGNPGTDPYAGLPEETLIKGDDLRGLFDRMRSAMAENLNKNYEYRPLSQNSNSIVDKVIKDVGLPPAKEVDDRGNYNRSPGSHTELLSPGANPSDQNPSQWTSLKETGRRIADALGYAFNEVLGVKPAGGAELNEIIAADDNSVTVRQQDGTRKQFGFDPKTGVPNHLVNKDSQGRATSDIRINADKSRSEKTLDPASGGVKQEKRFDPNGRLTFDSVAEAAKKAAAEKAAAEKAKRDHLAGIEALRQAELQRQKAIEDRARRERELREVQERQKAMREKAQREMEEQRRQREAEQAKRAAEQERLRQEAANIRIPGSGNTTRPAPGVPTPRPRPVVSPPRGGGRGPFIGFPVVLDLNGDGRLDIIQLDEDAPAFGKSEFDGTAKESVGPTFDWDGDSVREQTAWVAPQDGLLTIELPSDGSSGPDGKIDQREEIAFALWKTEEERQAELKELGIDDTGRPVTDIEGLRFAFDINRDNVLDQNDARWDEFRIWQDINQNAISDEGELLTMEQAGIKLINLLPTEHGSKTFADGSTILGTTVAQLKDGTAMLVGDVALSYKVL